ncbi:MAG: hypothetical protein OEW58_04125 [Gammaproteobacteria bacterium]|nr:hypothetical protein [Gammaproteobacteria bacterium]
MKLSVGISAYLNNFSQPLAADIGLHGFMKQMYGKLVPFYRLRLGGECAANNAGLTLLGPEIPVVRARAAIARIEHTFEADAASDEAFTDWVCRKQLPFFTELLDDFLQVSPSDLTELLADFAGKQDFAAIMLDSMGRDAQQNPIAALLDEARSEQQFRNTLLSAGELSQVLVCNENVLDLVAKAAIQSRGGVRVIEGGLALPLARALPDRRDLVNVFTQLHHQLQGEKTQPQLLALSEQVDRWVDEVREASALPLEKDFSADVDLSADSAPVAFLKLKQRLLSGNAIQSVRLASVDDAAIIVSGLKAMGVELVVREQAQHSPQQVLLVSKDGLKLSTDARH